MRLIGREKVASEIKTVGIVGAGFMGCQIASRASVYGYTVRMFDVKPEVLSAAKATTKAYTDLFFGDKADEIAAADARISYHDKMADALAGVDLVIEAVPELVDLKKKVFAEIEKAAPPHAIIATNSSSIPVSCMIDSVQCHDRVANVHFYIPIGQRNLVDIMGCAKTSPETIAAAESWVRSIECVPIVAKKECLGFVFNRIWHVVKKEALKVWAEGYADFRDIDRAYMIFFGWKIGVFGAMDSVGLDVVYDIEMSYYNESKDPKDKPPQALKDMIEKGQLGVKTGKGFYDWSNPEFIQPDFLNPKKK
jgi:3-hydroxybutyryl-CoA dehydrogenase